MKKVINYIANGQGLAVKYLAVLALVLSVIFGVAVKIFGTEGIPYAQQITDQLFPLTVVDGKIVAPVDTYKTVHIRFSEDADPYPLPIVLDTSVDEFDINTLAPGAYISRSNIYVVKQQEVRTYKLEGSYDLPREDYTGWFTSMLNWTAVSIAMISFVGLFVFYFVLALMYSVCAIPVAALCSKKADFSLRMRLSTVALITAYLISWGLYFVIDWGLGTTLFFCTVVVLQAVLLYKLPAPEAQVQTCVCPTETPADTEPVVEVKSEAVQVETIKKPKTKKAPAKKKPAAKAAKPKAPAKGKPVSAKKAKPAAKK